MNETSKFNRYPIKTDSLKERGFYPVEGLKAWYVTGLKKCCKISKLREILKAVFGEVAHVLNATSCLSHDDYKQHRREIRKRVIGRQLSSQKKGAKTSGSKSRNPAAEEEGEDYKYDAEDESVDNVSKKLKLENVTELFERISNQSNDSVTEAVRKAIKEEVDPLKVLVKRLTKSIEQVSALSLKYDVRRLTVSALKKRVM